MIKTDVLIVGAGVAGLSTAYFLGKSGMRSVIVLEQERKPGGHASGRNAGMLRQALPDPVLARLAKESRGYFDALGREGWKGLSLQKSGSLLLAKGAQMPELKTIERSLRRVGLESRWLSHREAERLVPVLKGGDFSRALFCGSDAMLDLEPLLDGFLRCLRAMGIPVRSGLALEDVRPVAGGFRVKAGGRLFFAARLVNAAGAWAPWVGKKAGAADLPFSPYRRHLFVSRLSGRLARESRAWPFVWDVSHDFYFRPVREGLLVSPCDKTLERRGDRREKVDPKMRRVLGSKLSRFSERLAALKVGRAKSGLRTMTPDGRFIIGEDPRRKGFYWVAGLGGHGVTTCFSVGRLAANFILGKRTDAKIAKALSPGRFA